MADDMKISALRFLEGASFFNYAIVGLSQNELLGRKLQGKVRHVALPRCPRTVVGPLTTRDVSPGLSR
jgi:hypothetical protein